MAGTPIPFPLTALPGERPGEGQGDLVNVYATKVGEQILHRRVAGLRRFTPAHTTPRVPRGMIDVDNFLLTVWGDKLEAISPTGLVATFSGSPITGVGPVTMARNIRTLGTQVAIVTSAAVYLADPTALTVVVYPDPLVNLGIVTSVDYYSGYFVFGADNGRIVASDLQNEAIPDNSDDVATAAADPLLRVINAGDSVLACGSRTIEAWQDVGKTPFPFIRSGVISVGILSRWGIAGGPGRWERGILFVASDFTVRQLEGYTPRIISNEAVSRDIYDYRFNANAIQAQVYVFDQQAIFSVSSPTWCWEYNLTTGAWHRRTSYGLKSWRAYFARQFQNGWYVQDGLNDGVLEVTSDVYQEDGRPLVSVCESGGLKDFPVSVRIPSVELDFSPAPGGLGSDPSAEISWSHDGGATWANPLIRALGTQGRFSTKVAVHNLGRSTHHGFRLRWSVSDPVPVTFNGAVAPTIQPSRARQVAR